jgi:hypothetical protein
MSCYINVKVDKIINAFMRHASASDFLLYCINSYTHSTECVKEKKIKEKKQQKTVHTSESPVGSEPVERQKTGEENKKKKEK